ncbi:MAG: hypothetical protein K2Y25_04055 [Pseudomonadaceae bacterium]|jgi:hypothetical protein|nr:hypothetical protein [Pseudomonadaceae bacterium]
MKLSPITLTKLTLLSLSSALLLACTTAPSNDVLQSKSQSTSVFVEGKPGGAFSEVEKISATVIAIDYKTRNVTLKDAQGNQRTVVAGPDVANLDQVKVRDQVHIVAALETVIYLQEHGQTAKDGAANIALSSGGNDVGLIKASSEQSIAVVTAVHPTQHQVTLLFPDNHSKTLPVRKDVAISAADIGKKVVINVTRAMAITVEKR